MGTYFQTPAVVPEEQQNTIIRQSSHNRKEGEQLDAGALFVLQSKGFSSFFFFLIYQSFYFQTFSHLQVDDFNP